MQIRLTERFQRDVTTLPDDQRAQLFAVMLKLPAALKNPRGIFEARIGLGLRLVFGIESSDLTLHRLGTHDEIRRYLQTLSS